MMFVNYNETNYVLCYLVHLCYKVIDCKFR